MNLTDKNKKILENIFGCQIDFDHVINLTTDYYNVHFANKNVAFTYDVSNNCYTVWDPTLFDIIKPFNSLLVLNIGLNYIDFMFIDDLVFINI